MSVGDELSSSVRAVMASGILDKVRKSAIRRFASGCKRKGSALIFLWRPYRSDRTALTGSSARTSLYSTKIFSKEELLDATASWYNPLKPLIRSFCGPKRSISFSRQRWELLSSPTRKEVRNSFSYKSHISADSVGNKKGIGTVEVPVDACFWRCLVTCWDKMRASRLACRNAEFTDIVQLHGSKYLWWRFTLQSKQSLASIVPDLSGLARVA